MANIMSSLKGGVITSIIALTIITIVAVIIYFGLKDKVEATLLSALAGASAGVIFSAILNIFPGLWLIPAIEMRKHQSIQEEIMKNEVASSLAGLVSSLEYLIHFDNEREKIISTHRYTLSRQLDYVTECADNLRKNIERLPAVREHPEYDSKIMQKVFIELGGVADKTKENVKKGDIKEFKGRNRTALKDKRNAVMKFKKLYESLNW